MFPWRQLGSLLADEGLLTPTELEVVKLVAEGLSNPQIAARMFISRKTVTTHLSHVFAKLDLPSRAALSAEAVRRGIEQKEGSQ